jgi:multidrug efflux pump subunit AcrA (membrane-fusion protein)
LAIRRRVARPIQRLLNLLVAGPVVALAVAGCAAVGGDQQPTPIPTSVTVEKPTYTVSRGDVVLKDTFTGTVVPINPVTLAFKVDGRIKNLAVKPGDPVKKDQVLSQLDISDLTRSLNEAQFNLDQDKVKLADSQKITDFALRKAEIDLDIKKATLAKLQAAQAGNFDLQVAQDNVSLAQIDIDELKSSVDEQAQQAVARDQTLLDQINSDVEARTIRSPIDGIVIDVLNKASSGATITAFQPAIQVGDPTKVEIAVTFLTQEKDLTVGQPATFTVPRLGDQILKATLRKGEGSASSNGDDQSARFSIDDPTIKLLPGENAYLSVVLKNETGVLWLPPNAIRTFMGRNFVVMRDGGVEKRVDVELGTTTSDKIVVLQGLNEGQVVIGP